jgi:hypothetical protein
VVDITGELPVILMELDGSGGIVKTYVYANSEVIAQHDGDTSADRYFYLHDRLGSVQVRESRQPMLRVLVFLCMKRAQ